MPTETEVGIGTPSTASSASATPWRIFSASTQPPVGSVSGRSTTNSSPPNRAPGVDPADAGADDVADEPQRAVAVEVAEAVVDRLEVVEVDHQQAEAAARAAAAVDLAIERREQVRPGAQARQRVLGRLPIGVLAGPPLLAPDRHTDVGDEAQGDEVDARGRERDLATAGRTWSARRTPSRRGTRRRRRRSAAGSPRASRRSPPRPRSAAG